MYCGGNSQIGDEPSDEAVVALAFALIKLEGSCPEAPRAAALEAIDRQLDSQVAARFGWNIPRERVDALGQLRAVLETSLPGAGSSHQERKR